jgi:hypothetical protein
MRLQYRSSVSNLFMTKGHTRYCEQVRGPQLEKKTVNGILTKIIVIFL